MTFQDVLAQVIAWLQRDKRVSYRALKRQFSIDNDYLEDLSYELIEIQQLAVDQDGKLLLWTGDTDLPTASDPQRETDAEIRFHAILPVLIGLLQREGRVTYYRLNSIFGLDDALLEAISNELVFQQAAVDE